MAGVFGRGIVKTVGDFGMQGELPSHPQLLDWLAVDFRTNHWNIKRLVKQIVMSATYKQSAVITKEHLAKDPENILLARAPRMRLSAELVRDFVLTTSGLLSPVIGDKCKTLSAQRTVGSSHIGTRKSQKLYPRPRR
jgi:hypothetical protein